MTDSLESQTISFAVFIQKGIERMAVLQKIALDFYAHQTVGMIDSWKKYASPVMFFPADCMVDAAGQGLNGCLQLQRNMVDLFVQQASARLDALRVPEPGTAVSEPNSDAMDELMTDQENEAEIAAKVVDRIEQLVSQSPSPLTPDAALQQLRVNPPEEGKRQLAANAAQAGTRRPPSGKKPNAAKQKNDW